MHRLRLQASKSNPRVDNITVITPPSAHVRRKRTKLTLVPPVADVAEHYGLRHLTAPAIENGVAGSTIVDALAHWDELDALVESHGCFDLAVVVSFGYFLVRHFSCASNCIMHTHCADSQCVEGLSTGSNQYASITASTVAWCCSDSSINSVRGH